ncbi:unnamed protein product [Linum tenue]|uniref:DUF1677 family protein n=2 Tax=Linum tenue TaxID=586396 RepID=A0AAV0KE01_9ROSI|nr:unnamed protein product [Linum tenue]
MSATMLSDPLVVSPAETQPPPPPAATATAEVESASCDCCGLTEECTPAYIERVRERYHGKWICGLCAEAVKDEIVRTEERLISTEEALNRHMNFCKKFSSSPEPTPIDPTLHLISAMRQILRRSLDSPRSSPRGPRSTPGSPTTKSVVKLTRSGSCFSTLSS